MTLDWMTTQGLDSLRKGYLLPNETPEDLYRRISVAAAVRLNKPELTDKFYEAFTKNWLGPASPVASNLGTNRGLPISCYIIDTPDTMYGIGNTNTELMMLTKSGGGVGIDVNRVRGRGSPISGNGLSEGIVPFCKVYDSTIAASNQGSVRRGAASVNLHVEHKDIKEFLRIRRPQGDINRQCLNLHQCVVISDDFMYKVKNGDKEAREIYTELLKVRAETGEPYLLFKDNVNKQLPLAYTNNGLSVKNTNICSEILLHTDEQHGVVCCLSSLNLARYDEWKDTDLVETAIWFLDGVMQEFIEKTKDKPGFERVHNGAVKGRPLGLGVMGWHTLLQSKGLAFDTSMEVMQLNAQIFKGIKEKATKASKDLAAHYGEPEWCRGTGMRNTHLLAVAPTVTNSLISGGISPGIEPITANAYADKTAKGVFTYQNLQLKQLLATKGKDTLDIWKSIVVNEGSVQQLDCLTDLEKEVFLTAREINQLNLVRQAASRQAFIDQGQSLNLFFPVNVDGKYLHRVHWEAWELGIKTLYYCRSSSILKGDVASRYYDENCKSCEG